MSASLVDSRIDLAEALADKALNRIMKGEGDLVKNQEEAARYWRQSDTLRFIQETPARQHLLAQDILNIRLACDNKSAKRQRR